MRSRKDAVNRKIKWFYTVYPMIAVLAVAFLSLSLSGVQGEPLHTSGKAVSGTYRVLLLGRDEASGLSDVMILATVDTQTGTACLMQIPRDTYFRYTDKDYKKINGAADALGSEKALCKLLGDALSVDIDSYVAMDLDGVRSAVDALGGVVVDVPCDMDYDDPAQGLSIHLKAGRQRLTGEQAAQFVRFRSGYLRADIDRMDAQKLFLAALVEAAREVDSRDLPKMAMLAVGSVRTDMSVGDMISLFRAARSVSSENITLFTLPGEEVQSRASGAWYYVMSRSGAAAALREHFGVSDANAVDSAHLFSNAARADLESVYLRDIPPQYYTVSGLGSGTQASLLVDSYRQSPQFENSYQSNDS